MNEGGIASPLIVHWPNGIKDQNKLRHEPCHFVDIVPTLVDLAGGKVTVPAGAPKLDGQSIAPVFKKDGTARHEFLYFNHSNNRALRVGDWKLIATGLEGQWELYDLSKDRAEQHNLATAQPERVKTMALMWKTQDDEFTRLREAAPATAKKRMNNRAA